MTNETYSAETTLAGQLERLLRAIQATGQAILPGSNDELLSTVVEAAARIFGAAAASIALVDEAAQELVFRVAFGAGSETVVGMRIPLDQGIAGYVANTGQPIAISNVQQDARFARDTAEKTGYVPRSILAMPLIYGDRVIGVMEVLDKISAPAFGMQDMELLGLFARQAAIAIHQSQQFERLNDVLMRGLAQLMPTTESLDILRAIQDTADPAANELYALADAFQRISALSDAERAACARILEVFGEYAGRTR